MSAQKINFPGYCARHDRVRAARGRASEHRCVHCAEYGIERQALDWARIHTENGLDPWADYVPLCRSCHMRYDQVAPKVCNQGENNGRARLNEQMVREILASDRGCSELARRFGVSRGAVSAVVQGRSWCHVRRI